MIAATRERSTTLAFRRWPTSTSCNRPMRPRIRTELLLNGGRWSATPGAIRGNKSVHPESPMVSAAKCGWHVREARFSDGSRLFFRFASVSSQNRLSSSRDPPSPAPRVGQERAPAPTRGALFVSRTASSRWLAGLMRPDPFPLGLLPSSLRFASNAATAFDNPLEFPPSVLRSTVSARSTSTPCMAAWQRCRPTYLQSRSEILCVAHALSDQPREAGTWRLVVKVGARQVRGRRKMRRPTRPRWLFQRTILLARPELVA
jgi:hypothetical protein